MLQRTSVGSGMPKSTLKPSPKEQIAQKNLQPNPLDKEGNFRWFYGYQSQSPAKEPCIDPYKKEKFQFLANMGLLPDNNILSNKLINIYGKRIFSLIHDKSRAVEKKKSLRKKIGLALGLAHAEFSENTRLDLHVCWMMVKKIRAIQKIDTLFNTTSTDFQENYAAILASVQKEIEKLKQLIPPNQHAIEPYQSEIKEIEALQKNIEILLSQLKQIKDHDVYQRNQFLQSWQRDLFFQFNYAFQKNEGYIGLQGLSVPLARENLSNSNIHTEAQYAIQEHTYSEWQPITSTQLWQLDDANCGVRLNSEMYCNNNRQRKELLLAACISEQLAAKADPLQGLDHIDQIQESALAKAREHYRDIKTELIDTSRKAKADDKNSALAAIKDFLLPQKIDAETGLALTSRELYRYKRFIQSQWRGREKLDQYLQHAIQKLTADIQAQGEDTYKNPIQTETLSEEERFALHYPHAPIPNPALLIAADDLLHPLIDFFNILLVFFDKDLAAKRPYISLFFFVLPCMQIMLPILANISSSNLMAELASSIFTLEANLAKYTGLNLFLKATIHQQLTAPNLEQATNAVRDAFVWFTCAESPIEQALIGTLIAKFTFNIADLILNNPLLNPDAALLSEYLTVLFPGSSGSLENTTFFENLKNFTLGFFSTIGQLGAAALVVGGLERFIPGMDILLSPLANVPLDKVIHPDFSSINLIQTLGVSKAAAFVLLKTNAILEKIKASQLIDMDGYKLQKDSYSFKVLTTFLELTHCSPEHRAALRKKMDPAAYQITREHFQELLAHNPSLWELYRHNGTYQNLKELGVEKITPKRRHKYPMAFLKTVPVVVKAALGILPGLIITLPFLLASSIKKVSPYALLPAALKPLYRYGVEAFNLHIQVSKGIWTFAKIAAHPFAAIGARCAEITVSAVLLPFFLAASVLRLFVGWPIKKLFHLANNPAHRFLVSPILKVHRIMAGWLREHVRYPLEKGINTLLYACRNIVVRKIEREIQVSAVVEKNLAEKTAHSNKGSTFDTFKTLDIKKTAFVEMEPCAGPADFIIKSGRTEGSAPTNPNRVSLSPSYPRAQIESVSTLHR